MRSLSRRSILQSFVLSVPAWRLAGAQERSANQPADFSTDVKVINVLATVHDQHGEVLRNLTKDDFILVEDGRRQTIKYFAQQSDLPLKLGLLVDTSGSERRMIGQEKDASYTFLEKVLRPDKDKAFLIHFDREVELLQDLTGSRERLEKALQLLGNFGGDPNPNNNGGWSGGGPGGGRRGPRGSGGGGRGFHGGGTTLYDAVMLASDEVLKPQAGRKAIILLTDGEDNGSRVSIIEATNAAQRANTLVYAVRIADENGGGFSGFGGPGMGRRGGMGRGPGRQGGNDRPDGKKVLQEISRRTGGGYFEVSKKETVDRIYGQIEDDLRNQYSIGYTSDAVDGQAGFRKISLGVTQKGATVQAREGYYAGAT